MNYNVYKEILKLLDGLEEYLRDNKDDISYNNMKKLLDSYRGHYSDEVKSKETEV